MFRRASLALAAGGLLWLTGCLSAKGPGATTSFSFAGPYTCVKGAVSHSEKFDVPPGRYDRVTLDMDVTAGPWPAENPRQKLNIFWLVRNHRNPDMLAYCALSRPEGSAPQLMLRQGIGVPHGRKTKDIRDVRIEEGKTYHFDYVYDMRGGHAVLTVTEGKTEIARIESVPLLEPPAKSIEFKSGEPLTIDLSTAIGDGDPHAAEAPSFGWTYSNLRVEVHPARTGDRS